MTEITEEIENLKKDLDIEHQVIIDAFVVVMKTQCHQFRKELKVQLDGLFAKGLIFISIIALLALFL